MLDISAKRFPPLSTAILPFMRRSVSASLRGHGTSSRMKRNSPNRGSSLAVTIASFPLLLVRGDDGRIRAFHNVCRHRAGPLAPDGQGTCVGMLVCRYHRLALRAGWKARGPHETSGRRKVSMFANMVCSTSACESWRGFVFITLMRRRLRSPPRLLLSRNVRATCHSNPSDRDRDDARGPLQLEDLCRELPRRLSRADRAPGAQRCCRRVAIRGRAQGEIVFHHAPPRAGAPMSGLWAWMWPCLGVNVYPNGLMMERMWPIDHARLDYLYFFPEDLPEAERDAAIASSEVTAVGRHRDHRGRAAQSQCRHLREGPPVTETRSRRRALSAPRHSRDAR